MPRSVGSPRQVIFRDFEWFDERTQVSVVVHGQELHELYTAMAKANDVPVAKLLSNSSIEVGERLKCHEITRKPRKWSWMPDSGGYLQPKLKQSCTSVGHSYLGEACDDEYRQRKRAAPSASADEPSPSSPPQRTKRARRAPPQWLEDCSLSPGSPNSESAGLTQPVAIRLHKAAFLASCSNPEAYHGLEIRHICGNTRCGVVSHFRAGSKRQNELDKQYKRGQASYSPESFPPPQP